MAFAGFLFLSRRIQLYCVDVVQENITNTLEEFRNFILLLIIKWGIFLCTCPMGEPVMGFACIIPNHDDAQAFPLSFLWHSFQFFCSKQDQQLCSAANDPPRRLSLEHLGSYSLWEYDSQVLKPSDTPIVVVFLSVFARNLSGEVKNKIVKQTTQMASTRGWTINFHRG